MIVNINYNNIQYVVSCAIISYNNKKKIRTSLVERTLLTTQTTVFLLLSHCFLLQTRTYPSLNSKKKKKALMSLPVITFTEFANNKSPLHFLSCTVSLLPIKGRLRCSKSQHFFFSIFSFSPKQTYLPWIVQ